MNYILDTHTFLWAISDPKKLPSNVIGILENPEDEIFVSMVNVWEICIKYSIGKLKLLKEPEIFLSDEIHNANFKILEIKMNHIFKISNLEEIHRDPFDRLLVAQSKAEKFPLITNDPLIRKYKVQTIW